MLFPPSKLMKVPLAKATLYGFISIDVFKVVYFTLDDDNVSVLLAGNSLPPVKKCDFDLTLPLEIEFQTGGSLIARGMGNIFVATNTLEQDVEFAHTIVNGALTVLVNMKHSRLQPDEIKGFTDLEIQHECEDQMLEFIKASPAFIAQWLIDTKREVPASTTAPIVAVTALEVNEEEEVAALDAIKVAAKTPKTVDDDVVLLKDKVKATKTPDKDKAVTKVVARAKALKEAKEEKGTETGRTVNRRKPSRPRPIKPAKK